MKLPSVNSLLGGLASGGLNPAALLGGIPGVLLSLLGKGSLKDNVLKAVRKRADAQEARTAGREIGFATHKIISAVAASTPAEHREEATRAAARAVALQYAIAGEQALKFADVALARESHRDGKDEAEKAALDAREAGEERQIQCGINIGRVCNGDAPISVEGS